MKQSEIINLSAAELQVKLTELRKAYMDLKSTHAKKVLSQEILVIIQKYQKYFDKIEEIVEFVDDIRHATGMRKLINNIIK